MRLYGEIIIDRTGAQTLLYLTCTTITSVDLRITEYLLLKIGYLWIVVQRINNAAKAALSFKVFVHIDTVCSDPQREQMVAVSSLLIITST